MAKKKAASKKCKAVKKPPKLPKPSTPAGLIVPLDDVLIEEVKNMTLQEAGKLVDLHHNLQDNRIKVGGAQRSVQQGYDETLGWAINLFTRMYAIDKVREDQIAQALGIFAQQHEMGRWAMGICGIADIMSAGLLAHINMDLAKTPGHIYAYGGIAPGIRWIGSEKSKSILKSEDVPSKSNAKVDTEKAMRVLAKGSEMSGVKLANLVGRAEAQDKDKNKLGYYTGSSLYKSLSRRPWNAEFKVLCWKIGESFGMVKNNDKAVYGKILLQRKAEEILKNQNGAFAAQAAAIMDASPEHKQGKEFYSKGILSPAHIDSRAKRFTTKIFLSHWWEKAYEVKNGCKPPFQPYPIDHLGHVHKIEAPNNVTGLGDADDVVV